MTALERARRAAPEARLLNRAAREMSGQWRPALRKAARSFAQIGDALHMARLADAERRAASRTMTLTGAWTVDRFTRGMVMGAG